MDDFESVLWIARECYVYQIPPRSSGAGYRANDWQVDKFLWKGRLRVMEIGSGTPSRVEIKLEDDSTGDEFAVCPYDTTGAAVEAVLDSSRYFVLRVRDRASGKHAYLGMGFPERSDAFDFNVCLQDWKKRQTTPVASAEDDRTKPSPHLPAGGPKDYSLNAPVTINIGKLGKRPVGSATAASIGGLGAGLLPPPPPAPRRARDG
ncbi:uncharacterized protein L969DRAFT_85234 [Mixia osmundae IAM 14324]|uniref:NECAP PHear domain-containing protein n=1 Tax=Mixia osmundae (strain CBS 9802 / IAM 14324 / JCM 22182 / KY 12970) TaxID=764103 RepID=G7DY82_MIXOS|nr:uncharacterized protein L969DRAFT_85234 [Mixia osmundae IAM 14324]KEI41445.1 hypothetical protein L969DRAFT_85234 [Mixia osmundae IAM 14324]GAA95542.1 hypothetical protein E5Q_02197 [Mixia osmundae IAM 14324]